MRGTVPIIPQQLLPLKLIFCLLNRIPNIKPFKQLTRNTADRESIQGIIDEPSFRKFIYTNEERQGGEREGECYILCVKRAGKRETTDGRWVEILTYLSSGSICVKSMVHNSICVLIWRNREPRLAVSITNGLMFHYY